MTMLVVFSLRIMNMNHVGNGIAGLAASLADDALEARRIESIDRCGARIRAAVADAKLSDVVVQRVARAVVDERIDREAVEELLVRVRFGKADGSIRSSGAYFVCSVRRLFVAAGAKW
jgi:hypothetical protein